MGGEWLLFFDLDGTLWDHKDISSLKPPFKKLGLLEIVDSQGARVRVYEDSLKILNWARKNGAIASTLSWNDPVIALEALRALGLSDAFDYHAIEPHPMKGLMAEKVLARIREERGLVFKPCRIIYVDDRDIHLEEVRGRVGNISFLQAWRDFRDFNGAVLLISRLLSNCK